MENGTPGGKFQMSIRATEQITNKILHKISFNFQNGLNNKPQVILLKQLFTWGSVNIWMVNIHSAFVSGNIHQILCPRRIIVKLQPSFTVKSAIGQNQSRDINVSVYTTTTVNLFNPWPENSSVNSNHWIWVKMIFFELYSRESCPLSEYTLKWFGGHFGTCLEIPLHPSSNKTEVWICLWSTLRHF